MPYWLLTSTTYGTWLPGDRRGSVTSVRDVRAGDAPSSSRREHRRYGDAYEPANFGLHRSARALLAGPAVRLTTEHAVIVVEQVVGTAEHRGWRLAAAAVMSNHLHVVLGVRDATDPRKLLTDLKSYASRGLNERFGKPESGRWWTRNGSRRRLLDQAALDAAVHYVLHKQPNPLALWPAGDQADKPRVGREP